MTDKPKSGFIAETAILTDRHTAPSIWDVQVGALVPARNEVATVTITLRGSGDTRSITHQDLINIIMLRLDPLIR